VSPHASAWPQNDTQTTIAKKMLLIFMKAPNVFVKYIEVHILNSGFASCMDLREVFALNLRRLRNAKGLSPDDLAYEAEVSRSYLSQLEKGAYYASLKIVGKLAAVLGVDPIELLRQPEKRGRREG
jgi:DNA-binding XRE family transcriptional regulator